MDAVRMAWRWLTRMKTALYILGVLGVMTLLATVVPQEPNVPSTVDAWRDGSEGPGVAVSQLIDGFGLYDTYGSPLFLALLLLLFLSLTACLVPRIRAFWRLARRGRPPLARRLSRQPHHETFTSLLPADRAHERARELLDARRFRLRAAEADDLGDGQVAAEKGIVAREGGSLVFHLSFYVLLVGVVLGQLMGFTGQVGVVEERAFTDTPSAYWSQRPGRWFGFDDHAGFRLQLDEFRVDWVRSLAFAGQPSLFEADVTVTEADGDVREGTIAGNVPMVVDGMKIHLLDWGYAPRFVVRVDGEVVHDSGEGQAATVTEQGFFRTAIKAPAADPGVGIEVGLYPYAPLDDDGFPNFTGAPWPDAPVAVVALWRGDLQLDRAQDVTTLDRSGMELADTGFVPLGGTLELDDGVVVEFPELNTWAGLQVSHRPTVALLLLGSALVLLGLVPALYAYRRRLWVRAVDAHQGGSLVEVAGRAFQRPDAFAREFTQLVTELRRHLDADEPEPGDPVIGPTDAPEAVSAPQVPPSKVKR